MKFEMHEFFKHKNCMDVFIRIRTIVQDDNNKAILYVDWMIQGIEMHWFSPAFADRIFIKADQYDNWLPYKPHGEIY